MSNKVGKRLLFERWRVDIFNRHVKWNQITWDVMKRHDESTYQNSSNIYDHMFRPNSLMGYQELNMQDRDQWHPIN